MDIQHKYASTNQPEIECFYSDKNSLKPVRKINIRVM